MEGDGCPTRRDQSCVWLMANGDKGSGKRPGGSSGCIWGIRTKARSRSWWCGLGSYQGKHRLDAGTERGEKHTELRAEQQPFSSVWCQMLSCCWGAQWQTQHGHSQPSCSHHRSLRLELLINSQRSPKTNYSTVMYISWQIPWITFFTTAERTGEGISRVFIGCIHAFFS